ncbi:DNA repair protein RecN [Robertkochia aurantiaca]|uniref:DNA repair protein RecN n=1 Tax=Robertkochia aurantiaca TaxID=2873700 RepID=UPI001CC9D512|nr:DNA repair protein RecN [Robertkochia sp. 3YJGBD-33]
MLKVLSIKNYALIDQLHVDFHDGFTTITGETGAGKSILLGGLSLVLGNRADLSVLRDAERKAVIEASFDISAYELEPLFDTEDLDYEPVSILRREILPGGKSRAFINDTPVTLNVLKTLGDRLIDIHSQHQTLRLTDNDFQFKVLDGYAGNQTLLTAYRKDLKEFQQLGRRLEALRNKRDEMLKEQDYHAFLLNELQEADLQAGMQEELEADYERLSNIESLKEGMGQAAQYLGEEQYGVVQTLAQLKALLNRSRGYGDDYLQIYNRVEASFIELEDTYQEIVRLEEGLEADPAELERVNARLQKLYDLQKKHQAVDVEELLAIKADLEHKTGMSEDLEKEINQLSSRLTELEKKLKEASEELRAKRQQAIPELCSQLENVMAELGMPNARLHLNLDESKEFHAYGMDELSFGFSANKGSDFKDLKKVASGGELSRIMLAIKSIMAGYTKLPTIMFDEIDTGVSGEISNRMGLIMKRMAGNMQVFAITHLPQIASLGDAQFKVFKEDADGITVSSMRKLSEEERISEIAEMLGGKDLSDSALSHARELLSRQEDLHL